MPYVLTDKPKKRKPRLKRNELPANIVTDIQPGISLPPTTPRYRPCASVPEATVLRRKFTGTSTIKRMVDTIAKIPNRRVECTPDSMPTSLELQVHIDRDKAMHGKGHK